MVEIKKFFFNVAQRTKSFEEKDVKLLSKIIDKHPYFQTGWSLLYKATTENSRYKPSKEISFNLSIRTLNRYSLQNDLMKHVPDIVSNQMIEFDHPEFLEIENEEEEFKEITVTGKNAKHSELIKQFLRSPKKSTTSKNSKKGELVDGSEDLINYDNLVDSEIATETLASIYVEQGKYDEAIQMYQILQLKFPEKRTTFADLIQGIKERKDFLKS